MWDNILPELLRLIAYFLTEGLFNMTGDATATPAGCQTFLEQSNTGYTFFPRSYEPVLNNIHGFVTLRQHVQQLLTFSTVCRTWRDSVNWVSVGTTLQAMEQLALIGSPHVTRLCGGGYKRINDPSNFLSVSTLFSNAFYHQALVLFFGWPPEEERKQIKTFMNKERSQHIQAAKDKLRIDWSTRDRRPTKRPKRY